MHAPVGVSTRALTHTFAVVVVLSRAASRWLWSRLRPTGMIAGIAFDLTRSDTELLAENAALRRQLILFRRQVKRPELHPFDRRMLLVHAPVGRGAHPRRAAQACIHLSKRTVQKCMRGARNKARAVDEEQLAARRGIRATCVRMSEVARTARSKTIASKPRRWQQMTTSMGVDGLL
jgi:hypothetical protein